MKRKFPRSASFDFDNLTFEDLTPKSGLQKFSTTNAVAYCRISTTVQAKESHGMEGQKSACIDYANASSYNIASFFADEAISGSKMDRAGLLELESYVRKQNKTPGDHNIKYLLCTEVSRLSRPEYIDEGLEILFRFLRLGLTIVDVFSKQMINRGNDLEMILALLKVSQAKAERDSIMARTKNGAMQRLKQGYWCFPTVPTGYKYIKKTIDGKTNSLVIKDEPNAGRIARGLRMYADGTIPTKRAFVDYLQRVGVAPNKTKGNNERMWYSIVYSMLKPERLLFYAGKIVSPRSGIVEPIEGKHKALISQAVFKKLLERIQKPLEILPKKSENIVHFPLRRILKCRTCGGTMFSSFVTSSTGRKYPYYECKNLECGLRKEGSSRSCPRDKVHGGLRDVLKTFQIPDKEKSIIKVITRKVLDEKYKTDQIELEEQKTTIKELNKSMNQLKKTMLGLSNVELILEYEKEWDSLSEEKNRLINLPQNVDIIERRKKFYELLEKTLKYFDKLVNIWDNGDVDSKRALVNSVFAGQIFYNKKEGFRTPFKLVKNGRFFLSDSNNFCLERVTRLERATICLEGRDSSQLSYTRMV